MKFNLHIFTSFLILLVTQMLFATPTQPDTCPNIINIKQTGIDYVFLPAYGKWVAGFKRAKYDTDFEWTFLFAGRDEDVMTENQAREKTLEELPSIKFVSGPHARSNGDNICIYSTTNSIRVFTITPPMAIPSKALYTALESKNVR